MAANREYYSSSNLFPTEYKHWKTEYMSNITTTIYIDDPVCWWSPEKLEAHRADNPTYRLSIYREHGFECINV